MTGMSTPTVTPVEAPPLSVVVLPFENLGGVRDNLVRGVTDDIVTDMSRFPDLHVGSKSSSFKYEGGAMDVRRIGEELGVRYAIEGSIRFNRGKLRINARLVSTETGVHLWTTRFDVRTSQAQSAVDDVVRQIVAISNARMLAAESDRVSRARPNNPNVADILLQARALRTNLAPSSQQWVRVVSLYRQAVERDSSSIMALTGLASALIDTVDNQAKNPAAPANYRRADELITHAESLRPDHVEVMCARVYLLGKQGRYTELIPIARRGIEAYPNRTNFNLWARHMFDAHGECGGSDSPPGTGDPPESARTLDI
jgi:TolB-like protein